MLQPDLDLAEEFRAKMATGLRLTRHTRATAFALGYMHGWTMRSAQEHAAECDLDDCKTCENFTSALSMFSAYFTEFPLDTKTLKQIYGA